MIRLDNLNVAAASVGRVTLHWYHWLVLLGSLCVTLGAYYISSYQIQVQRQDQFHYHADQIVELVKERMNKYESALWSGVGAMHSQDYNMTLAQWRKFSNSLSIQKRLPGINGVGVIYHVEADEKEAFIALQRLERPEFNIFPAHIQSAYWPIVYIEPESINKAAIGLDVAHETNRYTAARRARDTHTPQITGPISLVQDAKKTPGFLFYVPFYNEAQSIGGVAFSDFLGLVYAPFIVKNLMEGTLQNKDRQVHFAIKDEDDTLYDELNAESEHYDPAPLFTKTRTIPMYGRQWQFQLQASDAFRQNSRNYQPTIILIGGVLIDVMLLVLFYVLTTLNKKSVLLAQKMTHDYQNSQRKLNATVNNMMDGVITFDKYKNILSMNPAAAKMLVTNAAICIGESVLPIFNKHRKTANEQLNTLLEKQAAADVNTHIKMDLYTYTGEKLPVELALNQADEDENDTYYIAWIKDLSLTRKAENELAMTLAFLNAAVQVSSSGVAIIDEEGQFKDINQTLAQWLGYTQYVLKSHSMFDILSTSEQPVLKKIMHALWTGEAEKIHQKMQFKQQDETLKWGMLSAAVVKKNEENTHFIVLHIVDV